MTSQEITTRTPEQELIATLRGPDSIEQVRAALMGTGISPTKFVRVAVTAINENPQLVGADRGSLFGSLMRCAQDGLLPDGREAALVMFGKKATYMPMVGGLRKIAAEYGWSIIAAVVHENDTFDPDPEDARANYRPARLGTDPGEAQGAYAVGQHRDGRRILEVMTLQEIEAVRATSRAKNNGPWVEWWGEMARKTVVRRLFKSLPLDPKDRERIDRVLAATDIDTGEAVELLYGTEEPRDHIREAAPSPQPAPQPAIARGEPDQREDGLDGGSSSTGPDTIESTATEIEFDAEPEPVRFPAGTHQGRTLDEVYADGADGLAYLRVAFKKARTEPLRTALNDFAVTHPDVTA